MYVYPLLLSFCDWVFSCLRSTRVLAIDGPAFVESSIVLYVVGAVMYKNISLGRQKKRDQEHEHRG